MNQKDISLVWLKYMGTLAGETPKAQPSTCFLTFECLTIEKERPPISNIYDEEQRILYRIYIYISYTYMYVSTSLHNFSQLVKVLLCLTELKNLVITFKSQILFCQHIKSGGGVGSS